ncbi:MAG: hypothetical protein HWN67_21680 [Candidatus Helarchaeota archaeon]|nr:hypothetical protein [Candidatus Helarchaeota archaeon]
MKKKAITLIVIVMGAFGLGFGYYILKQRESMNPISILLVSILKPPPKEHRWTWVSGNDTIDG